MPRKPETTPLKVSKVSVTRRVTCNLGDFESMAFEMTAEAETDDTAALERWLDTRLDEWVSTEIDPFDVPRVGPKPGGQVARYYKDRTTEG